MLKKQKDLPKTTWIVTLSFIASLVSNTQATAQQGVSFTDKPAFPCGAYPLYENFDHDIFCNSPYDSLDRLNYALEHNYQYLWPSYPEKKQFYHDRFKEQFTSALNGLIDTAKIHQLLKEIKENPDSNSLPYIYSVLTSNIVCMGTIVDKKLEKDTTHCHAFKTKYLIQIDSLIYSNVRVSAGDTVLAGTLGGFLGGCAEGDPSTLINPIHAPSFALGTRDTFLLSNVNSFDSEYRRCSSNNDKKYNSYFCENLLRMRSVKYKSFTIKSYLSHEWD